jgi:hypothetical protein
MPRKFVAQPQSGFPGFIDDNGKQLDGVYTLRGEIYDAAELPPMPMPTFARLKAKGFWDPATSSLKVPFGDGYFTIGPDILGNLSEAGWIRLRLQHYAPPPKAKP